MAKSTLLKLDVFLKKFTPAKLSIVSSQARKEVHEIVTIALHWNLDYRNYYNWEDKELRTVTAGKREAHLLVRRHRAVAGGNKKFDSKDLAEEFAAINCGIWTLVKMDANRK
ncbi:hypothetical protein M514_24304 [Trichuris suis]|uniref:Uncharacterized protein n=1 Tax=Trichuris suis TaxID=68888 RepID=A0A085N1Z9_9BILA|nr:hypothetical protein M514_24304 [Trichuris suis]